MMKIAANPLASPTKTRFKRFKRFDLKKALFILPNLFTLSSIGCGLYAITLVSNLPKGINSPAYLGSRLPFYYATLAVFFGMFFDGADGRVARLTKTQSAFGMELDSLADVITFGLAPALILYQWGLKSVPYVGFLTAFIYIACGALRLARFNVLTSALKTTPAEPPPPNKFSTLNLQKYFIGLPIPLAAAVPMSLVMFHERAVAKPLDQPSGVILLVWLISYLMISNIRYRTFKELKLNRVNMLIFLLLGGLFVVLASHYRASLALLIFIFAYVLLGLLEAIFCLLHLKFTRTKSCYF